MKLHHVKEAEDDMKINLRNITENQIGFILQLLTKMYEAFLYTLRKYPSLSPTNSYIFDSFN